MRRTARRNTARPGDTRSGSTCEAGLSGPHAAIATNMRPATVGTLKDEDLRETRPAPNIQPNPSPLDALARSREGEPLGEPWRNPARTEPRPPGITHGDLAQTVHDAEQATALAHQAFLRVAHGASELIGKQLAFQLKLIEELRNRASNDVTRSWESEPPGEPRRNPARTEPRPPGITHGPLGDVRPTERESREDSTGHSLRSPAAPTWLDRSKCLEFAVGRSALSSVPNSRRSTAFRRGCGCRTSRSMLVDRILSIEGQPRSLQAGRVVTEHVIEPDAWYLDGGRIAPCIAIEAGQADLFLCGYLGVDFETKGLAVYRLLDATVTFHRGLPAAGAVIRYDIRITNFFRQGKTILFRFQFDATVAGEPLLTMRDGCAGFFTPEELAAGKGIVPQRLRTSAADKLPLRRRRRSLVPMAPARLDEHQGRCPAARRSRDGVWPAVRSAAICTIRCRCPAAG